jgi:hypothetical protein
VARFELRRARPILSLANQWQACQCWRLKDCAFRDILIFTHLQRYRRRASAVMQAHEKREQAVPQDRWLQALRARSSTTITTRRALMKALL